VYLKDIWPSAQDVDDGRSGGRWIRRGSSQGSASVLAGDAKLERHSKDPAGKITPGRQVHLRQDTPYFDASP